MQCLIMLFIEIEDIIKKHFSPRLKYYYIKTIGWRGIYFGADIHDFVAPLTFPLFHEVFSEIPKRGGLKQTRPATTRKQRTSSLASLYILSLFLQICYFCNVFMC